MFPKLKICREKFGTGDSLSQARGEGAFSGVETVEKWPNPTRFWIVGTF
jgi:hypothetical protein